MQKLYSWVKFALFLCLAFWMCLHFAHFTEEQSILLAFMAAALASLFATKEPPSPFERFYIEISPQWYQITKDHGLLEQYRSTSVDEKSGYSVLRDGIRVTVMAPNLYYLNNRRVFLSKLDLRESMLELLSKERHDEFAFAPMFYMKVVLEKRHKKTFRCIQFGLKTEESIKRGHYPDDEEGNIPLANLPHALFNGYNNGCFELDKKLKKPEIEKLLKEYGWEHGERSDDDYLLNLPAKIKHKYVKIYHDAI